MAFVVDRFEDAFHFLPEAIQHFVGRAAAADFNQHFEERLTVFVLIGDEPLFLFAKKVLTHDLLHFGRGGVAGIFEFFPPVVSDLSTRPSGAFLKVCMPISGLLESAFK